MPFALKHIANPVVVASGLAVLTTGLCLLVNLKSDFPGKAHRASVAVFSVSLLVFILLRGKMKLHLLGFHLHLGLLALLIGAVVFAALWVGRERGKADAGK